MAASAQPSWANAFVANDYARSSPLQEHWALTAVAELEKTRWLGPGAVVLDIGCFDGRVTRRIGELMAPARGEVTGIDLVAASVAHAQAQHAGRIAANGVDVRFEVADATQLPSGWSCRFDLITSFSTLHWIADQAAVMAQVVRCLAPGGRFRAVLHAHGSLVLVATVARVATTRPRWQSIFGTDPAALPHAWHLKTQEQYRTFLEAAAAAAHPAAQLRIVRLQAVEEINYQTRHQLVGRLRTAYVVYKQSLSDDDWAAFVHDVADDYLAEHGVRRADVPLDQLDDVARRSMEVDADADAVLAPVPSRLLHVDVIKES